MRSVEKVLKEIEKITGEKLNEDYLSSKLNIK